ncbi:MAG: hypothetical protein ACFFFT_09330 [Candidatus Thorarchaeota archaeon]
MIEISRYYCTKCKKHHHRGNIYREHLKFKKKDKCTKTVDYENIKINFESLRPIARRQLNRLLKKIDTTGNHEIYKMEIIKLIKNERRN